MTHPRQDIRTTIAGLLEDAEIVPAGQVYSDRGLVTQVEDLPVINVTTGDEESSPRDLSTKPLRRTLTINVEGKLTTALAENVDDALDSMAEDIETALNAEEFWGELEGKLVRTSSSVDNGGDRPVGTLTMIYTLRYIA